MSGYSLHGRKVRETYHRLLQVSSGGTVYDGSGYTCSLRVSSLSADTLFIGTQSLYDIFSQVDTGSTTLLQGGINTFTGGTSLRPTVNITGGTFTSLTVTGDTNFNRIFSGGTNVDSLFARTAHGHIIADISELQAALDARASLSGANFTGIIQSGGTDIGSFFEPAGSTFILPQRVAFGSADSGVTYSGNLIWDDAGSALTVNRIVFRRNYSGGFNDTIDLPGGSLIRTDGNLWFAAGTNLLFNGGHFQLSTSNGTAHFTIPTRFGDTNTPLAWVDVVGSTSGQASVRIMSGVTVSSPRDGELWNDSQNLMGRFGGITYQLTQNLAPIYAHLSNKADLSGATFTGTVVLGNARATTFSATTLSAGSIASGGTDLSQLFMPWGQDLTDLAPIYTHLSNKANLSGATFTGDVVLGTGRASAFSATTLSGGTIHSGGTEIGSLFARTLHEHGIADVNNLQGVLSTKASLSGANFSGVVQSGGTDLYGIFAKNVHLHGQADVDNLSATLGSKANLSGATFGGSVYVPTFSGGTFFSGSTPFENLFVQHAANIGIGNILLFKQNLGGILQFRSISAGTNVTITTGDTITISATGGGEGVDDRLATKANLSGATFTGDVAMVYGSAGSFSSTTLSASTLNSGSTNVNDLFVHAGDGGEVNTASNVGSANAIFKGKNIFDLQFRTLSAGTNVTLVTGDTITIHASIPPGEGSGDMQKVENLSGLTDYQVARNNLGLGDLEYRTNTPSKYKEFIYSGDDLTRVNIWADSGMTTKLWQTDFAYYGGNLTASTVTRIVDNYIYRKVFSYDGSGNLENIDVEVI